MDGMVIGMVLGILLMIMPGLVPGFQRRAKALRRAGHAVMHALFGGRNNGRLGDEGFGFRTDGGPGETPKCAKSLCKQPYIKPQGQTRA